MHLVDYVWRRKFPQLSRFNSPMPKHNTMHLWKGGRDCLKTLCGRIKINQEGIVLEDVKTIEDQKRQWTLCKTCAMLIRDTEVERK